MEGTHVAILIVERASSAARGYHHHRALRDRLADRRQPPGRDAAAAEGFDHDPRHAILDRVAQYSLARALADLNQVDQLLEPRAGDEQPPRWAMPQPDPLAFDTAKRAAAGRIEGARLLAVRLL